MSYKDKISLTKADVKRLSSYISSFSKAKILVLGDFILDQFVWGSVTRISPEAPVPVVNVNRESYMPGGSLNVANNIRSLGGIVYPCGVLGRDLEGRMLIRVMRREGIETGGVIYDRERPTCVKTRIIAHSQQVVRFDREKVGDISPDDCKKMLQFIQERIDAVDVVIIEDYGKGVVQPALLKAVVKMAKQCRKPVLVDPKVKHFSYYMGVTALTPNRSEAFAAYENLRLPNYQNISKLNVDEVGRALLKKLKAKAVLLTLGEGGMALYEKAGKVTKIPTTAREVYDVSGAGDTVIAVFALALAAGAKMPDAAILSNLAAGIVVGKLGTATVAESELQQALLGQ